MSDAKKRKEEELIERLDGKVDTRADLERFDTALAQLKVEYEQHFMGIRPLLPDKLHNEVKALLRKLRRAPFKTPELSFRLRTLESTYQTLHTYWMRVQREREAGTYHRDVFKADLHERIALEAAEAQTGKGKANQGIKDLFKSYKDALENQAGRSLELNFEAFRKSLIKRAKDLKEQHGIKKLSFKVVTQDGKVLVKAIKKE